MKFIDLFSGIGGFRAGMEMNGHECVAFCEIDKYARQSYKAIYDTEGEEEWHDITQVSNDDFRYFRGRADVITGGFPCQAFSLAGKRRGFEDTRGTLFFEIARAIKEIEPSYILLENVKGLFSHDKGRTFGTIIQALDELGYVVEWGLFNSKYWGVPQNRERVFILVTRKDVFKAPKLFELLKKQTEIDSKLIDILETDVDEKYFLSEERTAELIKKFPREVNKGVDGFNKMDGDVSYALTTRTASCYLPHHVETSQATLISVNGLPIREATKKGYAVAEPGDSVNISFPDSETRRGRVGKQIANTLLTGEEQAIVLGGELNAEKIERDTFEILQKLQEEVGEKEVAKWRSRILDTFQQEKILRQDVYEERLDIEQDKEKFKRKEQSVERKNEDRTFDGQKVLREMPINKEFRCSSHGREPLQQFTGEFTSVMQKLSYETSQEKNLYHLRKTTQGIRLLRKALSEIQEIWEPLLHKKQSIRIRKLVPIEVWRLQGFTDEQFYKAKNDGVSNSQLYKQAGNSVTVNVIDAIAKML